MVKLKKCLRSRVRLKDNLEEEHELRVSLEQQLESIEESNDVIVAKLIKERDHTIAKYKACKK